MQMLMTQITHQNPLEPMNDSEMMNQYVQLNSLNTLQSIQTSLGQVVSTNQTGYAASLIGKTVKATDADGKSVQGVVKSVTVQNGAIQLLVGKVSVPLANVTEVTGG
jgi:flagellar basal-body rod modification protein FlgD